METVRSTNSSFRRDLEKSSVIRPDEIPDDLFTSQSTIPPQEIIHHTIATQKIESVPKDGEPQGVLFKRARIILIALLAKFIGERMLKNRNAKAKHQSRFKKTTRKVAKGYAAFKLARKAVDVLEKQYGVDILQMLKINEMQTTAKTFILSNLVELLKRPTAVSQEPGRPSLRNAALIAAKAFVVKKLDAKLTGLNSTIVSSRKHTHIDKRGSGLHQKKETLYVQNAQPSMTTHMSFVKEILNNVDKTRVKEKLFDLAERFLDKASHSTYTSSKL